METWKNIYMDRRRPPPPAGKWKITRPPPGWKCKLLLNPCKIVRILTVQNWAKFFHILPIVGKQLFTKPVENSVENLLITHSLWKTLWKTPCINIHHFCINIHSAQKIPTPPHYINSDIPSRPALYLAKTARYDKSRVKFAEYSTIFEFASCNIISCNTENQLENLKTRIIPDRIRHSSRYINHIQTSRYARCRTSILHIIS